MTFQSLSIFVLFILYSPFHISHAHYSPSSEIPQSPHNFLNNLTGTHQGQFAAGVSQLKKYLSTLGYLERSQPTSKTDSNNDYFDVPLEAAIKKYQEFYKLNITGIVDEQTLDMLSRPRCGVPDFFPDGSLYSFVGSVWPPGKRVLTVSEAKTVRNNTKLHILFAMAKWVSVSPFEFTYKSFGKTDVSISFRRRAHGDGFPFNGPMGPLAHTFPPTDGRLHFNADINWITLQTNPENGFDFESVALHELGHIFGLGHSTDPKASMFPTFLPGEKRDLNDDDIQAIHALYPNN